MGDGSRWSQPRRPHPPMTAVLGNDRPPPGEPAPRLILALRSSHSRSLHEADRVGDLSRPARSEDAFLAVQVLSGVDRKPFYLGYREVARAPRILAQLEAGANRPIGSEPVRL